MPRILTNIHKQWLARRVKPFILQKGIYHMGQYNKFRCCVTIDEAYKILRELHEGFSGGHFAANITAKKILDVGYQHGPSYFMMLLNFADLGMHVKELEVQQQGVWLNWL